MIRRDKDIGEVIKGVRFQVYVSSEEGIFGWTSMSKKTIQVSNVMVKDSN